MKIIFITILFLSCLQITFAQRERISNTHLKTELQQIPIISFHQKGDEIWFFEHENFKGKKLVLKVGTYTTQQMGIDWNDSISSILIPEGYEIQIFVADNFSGYNASLDGYWQEKTNMQRWSNEDYKQLKTIEGDPYKINFNDKISSIQVYNQR